MKWSYSRLTTFEKCPWAVKLQYVDKLVSTVPPSEALNRGNEVHLHFEQAIRGEVALDEKFEHWKPKLEALSELYLEGKVQVEEDWGLTEEWEPCSWTDEALWLRFKLDVFIREDETSAIITDWKTGKWMGNEVKHGSQAQLYALGAFAKYPELEFIQTEMAYIDHNKTVRNKYTRKEYGIFRPRFHARALKLTTAETFKPKPSKWGCKWCNYNDVCDFRDNTS